MAIICTLWLLLTHRAIKKLNNHRHSVDAHLNLYFSALRLLLKLMPAMSVKPSKQRDNIPPFLSHTANTSFPLFSANQALL